MGKGLEARAYRHVFSPQTNMKLECFLGVIYPEQEHLGVVIHMW